MITPLLIAFDLDSQYKIIYYIDKIVNILFAIDVILNFFMAQQDEDTLEVEVRHSVTYTFINNILGFS